MRDPIRSWTTLSLLVGVLGTGCGGIGSASIEGDVGGYTMELNTIFGWIDAKELDNGGDGRAYVTRDEPRLFLRFSAASFDPEMDQRLLSPAELLDLGHAEELGGSIAIRLTRYNEVTAGQVVQTGADGPDLNVDLSFALMEVPSDATFPGELPVYGSRFTGRLNLEEAGKQPGESVVGNLELILEADGNDPAGARTGKITIDFSAPLIEERIAECNEARSSTDPACEPEYPRGN